MTVTLGKALLHLVVIVFLSFALLEVLFYLHGIGINSLLIPHRLLRQENGTESKYVEVWYIMSCTISYLEWLGLIWLVNKFNYWYGPAWLKPSQMWIAKAATVSVASLTAICVAIYYVSLFGSR